MNNEEDKLATKDDDIIAECIERRRLWIDYNSQNVKDARDDLNFLAGNQLSEGDIIKRTANAQPVIQINKLQTFLRQVTNDNLENTPSIKVHPVSGGADEEVAEILSGMIKNIEYSSNADTAYDTAVNSAAAIGFGYFRLITQFCDDVSFDQEIKIARIANQFTVKLDFTSTEPDGSDAQWGIIDAKESRISFKRLYPKSNIDEGFKYDNQEWISDTEVLIAEYYRIEYDRETICLLSDGSVVIKSKGQIPEGLTVLKERVTHVRKLMLYKLTAVDILERTEIKCPWIPIFPVYGNEINLDGRVTRSGIIRYAKDPCRLYSYFWSAAAEEIAARSKTPWIMAEGQDAGYENDWRFSNKTTKPTLKYQPTTFQGLLVPPPHRNQPAEFPSGFMAMAMQANDDIKATTGLFDSSLGAKGNATSGRQEIAQQRQGDLANANYADSLAKSIRQCGRCIVEMIPFYYDTPRIERIIGVDGSVSTAKINQPMPPEVDDETGAIKTIMNDLTIGKYDVTISTGPSYQTQRLEAADSMLQMAQNYPQLMEVAGDKVIRALDWPGGDEIADRVKKAIPAEITAGEDGDEEEQQLPPEVLQSMKQDHDQMEQMNLAMQQMQAELEKAQSGNEIKLQIEQIKSDTALMIQDMKGNTSKDVEELKGMIQILLADKQAPLLAQEVGEDLAEETEQPQGEMQ